MRRILFLVISFLSVSSLYTILFAEEMKNFTITSDYQKRDVNGNFEAHGNVVVKAENNFKAKSNKAFYNKEKKIFKLTGNVILENFESEETFIEKAEGNELIIFIKSGSYELNSKSFKRVKTKLKVN